MTIAQIIEDQLGIKSEKDFEEYFKRKLAEGITQADIDLLDPDTIDCTEFWSYIDTRFDKSVCGQKQEKYTRESINFANLRLAMQTGLLGWLDDYGNCVKNRVKLLEIGPGYGSIYNEYKLHPDKIDYHMCDVVPKFNGVVKSDGHRIPQKLMTNDYDIVICCNVMQHLSLRQRFNYYVQITDCLKPYGLFLVTGMQASSLFYYIPYNNENYICHYGQFTPLQHYINAIEDIDRASGKQLYTENVSLRQDGLWSLVCRKYPQEKVDTSSEKTSKQLSI